MPDRPQLRVSELRKIGWTYWDPIGLAKFGFDYLDESCADEYDSYLIVAAGMLRRGSSVVETAKYLDKIASDDMGGRPSPEVSKASLKTAEALAKSDRIWSDGFRSIE